MSEAKENITSGRFILEHGGKHAIYECVMQHENGTWYVVLDFSDSGDIFVAHERIALDPRHLQNASGR